jgi:hypothetical protein
MKESELRMSHEGSLTRLNSFGLAKLQILTNTFARHLKTNLYYMVQALYDTL